MPKRRNSIGSRSSIKYFYQIKQEQPTPMKLLPLEDYLSPSPSTLAGVPADLQLRLTKESLSYLTALCESTKVSPDIMQTALTIFHFYLRRHSFTDLDRFLVATSSAYLACKIDYKHLQMEAVTTFLFNNRKGTKRPQRGTQEIYETLQLEIAKVEIEIITIKSKAKLFKIVKGSRVEIEMLAEIEFDLEFDNPSRYMQTFRRQYSIQLKQRLGIDTSNRKLIDEVMTILDSFIELASKFVRDSYLQPLCLYFPDIGIPLGLKYFESQLYNQSLITIVVLEII